MLRRERKKNRKTKTKQDKKESRRDWNPNREYESGVAQARRERNCTKVQQAGKTLFQTTAPGEREGINPTYTKGRRVRKQQDALKENYWRTLRGGVVHVLGPGRQGHRPLRWWRQRNSWQLSLRRTFRGGETGRNWEKINILKGELKLQIFLDHFFQERG